MRACNYKVQSARTKDDDFFDDAVKANSTLHGGGGRAGRSRDSRGRGGGRGRGESVSSDYRSDNKSFRGRGGNRGQGTYGGKRGESSKTCLVCDKDHQTSKCDTWRSKATAKSELFAQAFNLNKKICTWCLEPGHLSYNCVCEENVGCPCGSNFSMYICMKTADCKSRKNWDSATVKSGFGNVSHSGILSPNGVPMGKSLLPVQDVETNSGIKLKTMFDNCSQSTFLSKKTAIRNKLKGLPIKYTLVCTDGREVPMVGRMYNLVLVDKNGRFIHIQAVGIDKLSGQFSQVKVTGIESIFNHEITDKDLDRDGGDLDLLIGTDLVELHPTPVAVKGKLVLLKSRFGSGWTLCGYDGDVIETDGDAIDRSQVNFVNTKDMQFLDLISMESIGIDVPRKCVVCKGCKDCNIAAQRMTYLESLEDKCINDSIEFMPEKKRYKVLYPYTKEVYDLLPNTEVAMNRALQLEQKLVKSPVDLASANKILNESFERGVFRYLTDEEMNAYSGPVHMLCMDRVYKESESTPCRLTFDSAQPDKNRLSLNGVMGKGSNPLQYFGGVVLNWRAAEQVACGDISKMFNRCEAREIDMHLRRFYVRPDGIGGKEPFQIAAITVINFGECAAGNIATAVKNRTATDNAHINPEVSKMIKNDCFMDDCFLNAKYGENIDDKIKDAEAIMAEGGFPFKEWVKNGDKGQKEIGKELSKALGVYWETEKDKIVYKVRINFSKKVRNRRLKPCSTVQTIESDFPEKFTKRFALKLTHSVFDPSCLVQPFILKLRLAYRDVIIQEKLNENGGWDAELSSIIKNTWIKLAKEMYELENISFDRSLVPEGYDENEEPMLLLFSDGSDTGQCTAAYLRWIMKDGSIQIRLVTSRVKIAALKKVTTPMSELLAAQISSRLKVWLVLTLNIKLGVVVHMVDSSIVLGMVQSISLKFDTFSAPRISEIQANTGDARWYWLVSEDNPADIGTRGNVSPQDLDEGTMWQEGPSWLKKPFSEWPIREDFKKHDLPGLKKEFQVLNHFTQLSDLIAFDTYNEDMDNMKPEDKIDDADAVKAAVNAVFSVPEDNSVSSDHRLIDYSKYRSWFKLQRVVAVMLAWKDKCKVNLSMMKKSRKYLLLQMMPSTHEMLTKKKFSDLMVITGSDGIVYVRGRTQNKNHNPDKLVLLNPEHPCTRLILKSFHDATHRSVAYTVARSRIWYWIPQATKIMKGIKHRCYECKIEAAESMQQIMAPLPALRLKPAPVWNFSMIDLAGPVHVKGFVNQRTVRKSWIVLITCLASRAILCYLAEDFSTDSLLLVLAKHEARNGSPAVYYADLGTQIRGASKTRSESDLAVEISLLDQSKMEKWGTKREIEFRFGSPHHPEGQGAIERLVAEVKKELKFVTKNRTLTFGQLDAALAECSYLVNCRPLALHPGPGGEEGYICPNDLMMGRSDKAPPMEPFEDSSLAKKVRFMRSIVLQFWERWYESYYQRLIKYHKWRNQKRNASPGDIVLILDRESPKGKFTLGEIVSIKIDEDNIVRKVMVRYKLKNPRGKSHASGAEKFMERNVRGLALVVTKEERTDLDSKEKEVVISVEKEENLFDDKMKSEDTIEARPITSSKNINLFDDNVTGKDEVKINSSTDDIVNIDQDYKVDDKGKNVIDEKVEEAVQSSSGRRRRKPQRFGFGN